MLELKLMKLIKYILAWLPLIIRKKHDNDEVILVYDYVA